MIYIIRKANINDAKEIAHIRVDGWKTAYKGLIPDSFLDTLNYDIEASRIKSKIDKTDPEFTSDILVYEEDSKVLAYAYYGKALDSSFANYQSEVLALYVLPAKKGMGIGTKLMNEIKELLSKQGYRNMIVWCLKGNYSSIKFYEHLGGVVKEEREFEIDGMKVTELGIVYELI